jgi:energy-coupling factor transporter transmembrane protein EcfT
MNMELFSENLRKDHLLSKVDARIKLLVALVLLAMILSYKGFFFPLFVILFCFLLGAVLRVPLRVLCLPVHLRPPGRESGHLQFSKDAVGLYEL